MTYQQMNLFYYLAFIPMIIGFILMIVIMFFIAKKFIRPTKTTIPNPMINVVLLKVIVLAGFPAILVFTIFSVPSIYMGNQQKQYEYCKKVVTVNNIHDTSNEFLQERCGTFDVDELIEIAWESIDGEEYMSEHTFSMPDIDLWSDN